MDAKKLLIVCDRDGKAGAQLLASLINAEGTVRGVPDPVNASVMDLYDWARVKPSDGYTLFFGDSDDLLLAGDGIPLLVPASRPALWLHRHTGPRQCFPD